MAEARSAEVRQKPRVAVHALLPEGDERAQIWFTAQIKGNDAIFSSRLLHLELVRTLRRRRLDLTLAAPILDRVGLVSIDDGIVSVAAAIEPHVKSLEALHLATCTMLGLASCWLRMTPT